MNEVQSLSVKLRQAPNQAINYYFFPYLWDLIGVLQSCSAFVKWLGMYSCDKGVLHFFFIKSLEQNKLPHVEKVSLVLYTVVRLF